jgi:hypothetical protein
VKETITRVLHVACESSGLLRWSTALDLSQLRYLTLPVCKQVVKKTFNFTPRQMMNVSAQYEGDVVMLLLLYFLLLLEKVLSCAFIDYALLLNVGVHIRALDYCTSIIVY